MRIGRINRFIALFLIFTLLFGLVPNTYDVYAVEKIIEEQNNSDLEIVPNVVSGSSIKNKKEIEEIQIDQQDNELKAVPSQMKVQLDWHKSYGSDGVCELIPSNEPDKNKIGSKAQCRLTLSWDGEETFDVGEIKVRMPQYIFQTRDGDDIGHYTLGIEPSGGQEGFGYYVENNEIIIFNEQKMEGAHNFICDFTYYTGCEYYPYRIKDNYIKEFSAIVQYGEKLQNQIESNSLKVCYHTDIILDRFWVNGEVCDFDVVKNRISVTDDDKDKYVYVEWTAIGNFERYTQLGNIEYQMDFDQNGVVVGYEDDKTWNTVETGSSEITLMDEIRYPYWRERFRTVLVRYEKPKVDTKFVCLSKAVVTGKDNNYQTKGASRDVCEWKETLPKEDSYGYKDGLFKEGKLVNNNLQTINEKGWYEQKIEYTIGTKIENLDALEQVQ